MMPLHHSHRSNSSSQIASAQSGRSNFFWCHKSTSDTLNTVIHSNNMHRHKFDFQSSSDRLYDDDDEGTITLLCHPTHLPLKRSASSSVTENNKAQQRWSIGKISVVILACLSLTDVIFHMVDAQMEYLESPEHYDALSADVIRPAFRYHEHSPQQHSPKRPTMGLGSAAISSVTTALSPILPFTGGIDLRREDYWTNGWWGSVSSVMQQVRDAFDGVSEEDSDSNNHKDVMSQVLDTPRGGAATKSKDKGNHSNKKNHHHHSNVLSSSEPFAPLKEIAELTLRDVAVSFQFAIQSTRRDFNQGKVLSGVLPRARKVMERMSTAVATARGNGVVAPITGEGQPQVASGDVDALSFCAAMRVFAEWRILRQVPKGYKGYEVGMTLGQKDIVQNIAKIEHAIHAYMDHRMAANKKGISDETHLTSPTLRDLLQYEVDMDIQDVSKLPRLKEKSAAMGLLWVRRQLQYQTAIFSNVIQVPGRFDSTRAAVQSAYDEVYNKYHGWAVQKIFSYSFQAAPDANEIYKYMDPHRLAEVQKEAGERFLDGIGIKRSSFRKSRQQSSGNPFEQLGRHIGREWDKLANNVVQEWDKLAGNVGQLFGQHRPQVAPVMMPMETTAKVMSPQRDVLVADQVSRELEMENFIDEEMQRSAYQQIRVYLEVAMPLLNDLESLFDEFNMDDPTKV
jgi:hypothetical protein